MSHAKRQGESFPPASLPPAEAVMDAGWDDDESIDAFIEDITDHEDPFDRPTAMPETSTEDYVAQMMAEADRAERGEPDSAPLSERPTPLEYLSAPRVPIFDRGAAGTIPDSEPHTGVMRKPKPASPPLPTKPLSVPQPISTARAAQSRPRSPLLADMRDRYAAGDFSGALIVAEDVLRQQPDDAEARSLAEDCRRVLTEMYAGRLGPLNQVAMMAIPADQIRWLSLDHRAGFLLSLVDGISSIEEILDVSGMARFDALKIMCSLLEQRVIALESRYGR